MKNGLFENSSEKYDVLNDYLNRVIIRNGELIKEV